MEFSTLRECLAVDFARLHGVLASGDPTAKVPSCPEWSLADLAEHVAAVYQHKVECMRLGRSPDSWPPDFGDAAATTRLDRSYAALTAEFTARTPDSATYTWYPDDQTVGFWIRRMAQETVIHRVDAELAAGVPIAAIPDDLACDGIDELIVVFLDFGSKAWADEYADVLATADGQAVRVDAAGRSWLIRLDRDSVDGRPCEAGTEAAAVVTGEPHSVLLWLWNRAGDDAVHVTGDAALVAYLRRVSGVGTQ